MVEKKEKKLSSGLTERKGAGYEDELLFANAKTCEYGKTNLIV